MEPDDTIDLIRSQKRDPNIADVNRLRELVVGFPNDPYLLDMLGTIAQLVNDPSLPKDFPLQCYVSAIEADPKYWEAHVSLGHWFDISADFQKSEYHFRLAIDCGAGDPARIGLASVLAQMGGRDQAFQVLNDFEDLYHPNVITMRKEIQDGKHDPLS